MNDLISAFGLDYRVMIANIINFTILMLILYKIGYKPILKFVQDRTSKIESGLANAKAAAKHLEQAKAEQEAILVEARKEAQQVLANANDQAKKQADAFVEKSRNEAQAVVDKAKKDIRTEHEKMIQEAKSELSGLVLLASEKLLQEKLDEAGDKQFVEKVLADIK